MPLIANGTPDFTISGISIPSGFSAQLRVDAEFLDSRRTDRSRFDYVITLENADGTLLDEVHLVLIDTTSPNTTTTISDTITFYSNTSSAYIINLTPNPTTGEFSVNYN